MQKKENQKLSISAFDFISINLESIRLHFCNQMKVQNETTTKLKKKTRKNEISAVEQLVE